MFRRLSTNCLTALLALGLTACSLAPRQEETVVKPRVGLFSSLPIYWGEGDLTDLIGDAAPGGIWVRQELEKRFDLVPLDTLEADALEGLDRVILAQPRALAPSENAAFDSWVEAGGRAVILADPMLTRHSRYPLGDKRRPQDVVLISPLLDHWGVELQFDEAQPEGERVALLSGQAIPVNLAGRFAAKAEGAGETPCSVSDEGLLARCRLGQGEVDLFADAAVLDWEGPDAVGEERRAALWHLLAPLTRPADNSGR